MFKEIVWFYWKSIVEYKMWLKKQKNGVIKNYKRYNEM